MVFPQLRHKLLGRQKDDFHIAGLRQSPVCSSFIDINATEWHTTVAHSIQISTTWIVSSGPHLDLQGTPVIWTLIDYLQHNWLSQVPGTFLCGIPPLVCTLPLGRSGLQRLSFCPLPNPLVNAHIPKIPGAWLPYHGPWYYSIGAARSPGAHQTGSWNPKSHSSVWDRDQVMISASSSSCCEGSASSSSLTVQTDSVLGFLFLYRTRCYRLSLWFSSVWEAKVPVGLISSSSSWGCCPAVNSVHEE